MSKRYVPLRLVNDKIILEPYEDDEYLFKSESTEKVNTFEILYEMSSDVFITLYRIDKDRNIEKVSKSFDRIQFDERQIDIIKYMLLLTGAKK